MNKLLVADSDQDSREHVTNLLQQAGFDVTATDSAADALNDTLRQKTELIILGDNCDEYSAVQLLPLLKGCNRRIPIILVSSFQSLTMLRSIREHGVFYHARKSFDPEAGQELIDAVRSALRYILRGPSALSYAGVR